MPPPTKRRKTEKTNRPDEIQFDSAARADYLSGFHKRKQARIKHAQEIAAKKEREERIRDRKELRQKRKEQLEEHVKAIDRAFKEIDGDDSTSQNISEAHDKGQNEGESDEWSGIAESIAVAVQPVDREDDYIDEENYTTVTVEEVGISKEGFAKAADDSEASKIEADADGRRRLDGNASVVQNGRKKPPQHRNEKERKPKKKQKKFRYENKADRKVARAREGSRNSKMAKARKTK